MAQTQEIPLFPYTEGLYFMPNTSTSNPHTPDPDDPNQFRATLTDNTLCVYQEVSGSTIVKVVNLFTQTTIVQVQMRDSMSVVLRDRGHYSVIVYHYDIPLIGHFSIYSALTDKDLYCIYSDAIIIYTEVVDLQGRLWIRTPNQTINLSNLPRGIYLIRVCTEKGGETHKILHL